MPKCVMAVTGGIGSGKSAFCAELSKLGVAVFDADDSARRAVAVGTDVHRTLQANLPQCFNDGELNRSALAQEMFSDAGLRQWVESVIHPWVQADMAHLAAGAASDVVALDIPLIAETRSRSAVQAEFDCLVTLWAPRMLREQRLAARGVSANQIQARMAAQATDEQRQVVSDMVVPNAGTLDDLAAHAHTVHRAVLLLPRRRS